MKNTNEEVGVASAFTHPIVDMRVFKRVLYYSCTKFTRGHSFAI